jgi:hypothetical protein
MTAALTLEMESLQARLQGRCDEGLPGCAVNWLERSSKQCTPVTLSRRSPPFERLAGTACGSNVHSQRRTVLYVVEAASKLF